MINKLQVWICLIAVFALAAFGLAVIALTQDISQVVRVVDEENSSWGSFFMTLGACYLYLWMMKKAIQKRKLRKGVV